MEMCTRSNVSREERLQGSAERKGPKEATQRW